MIETKCTCLVDGNFIFWRAYHTPGMNLSHRCDRCRVAGANDPKCPVCAGTGREPTKATYGFIREILSILKESRPRQLAVVFDGPRGELRRRAIWPGYKANRDDNDDPGVTWQMIRIKEILRTMGVCVVECRGHEADDALATLAVRCATQNRTVTIITRDKDIRQLCSDRRIKCFDPVSKTTYDWITAGKKWGIRTRQIFDMLVLSGDGTDGIPGIMGIGEKTAAKLLQLYRNVDGVIAAANGGLLTPKTAESIKNAVARGYIDRNKTLVQLDRNISFQPGTLVMRTKRINLSASVPLFKALGFRSLLG